jgi:metal-sulfur cluster biosynthetic enzyme
MSSAASHDHIPPAPNETSGTPVPPPAHAGSTAAATTEPPGDQSFLTADYVKTVLRRVKDPELNLNIIDLGLVYDIRVDGRKVAVDMSLTSPGCPSGPEIMGDVERQLKSIPEVEEASVNLVWSPFWTPDRIEPRVRAYLGF